MSIIKEINSLISNNKELISNWLFEKTKESEPPFYTSTDIRVSDKKITAVDTNIFPAGFNNLSDKFIDLASKNVESFFRNKNDKVRKILIIPELHTRNPFYWDNILSLQKILYKSGIESKVGLIVEDDAEFEIDFDSSGPKKVNATTIKKEDNKIIAGDFVPDLILINNDFSNFFPEILLNISQAIVPPIEVGWHTRKKNIHFFFYNKLVDELSELLNIDEKIFSLETKLVEKVNIESLEDRVRVAKIIEQQLTLLNKKSSSGEVFIKNNSGTYGMSVMNISAAEDFINLNREGRKKMKVSKGGMLLKDLIIQESVPTIYKNKEPVYYLINNEVSGAFYRINDNKDENENLNTKGMYFEFSHSIEPSLGLIAKVGAIATGLEIKHILNKNRYTFFCKL